MLNRCESVVYCVMKIYVLNKSVQKKDRPLTQWLNIIGTEFLSEPNRKLAPPTDLGRGGRGGAGGGGDAFGNQSRPPPPPYYNSNNWNRLQRERRKARRGAVTEFYFLCGKRDLCTRIFFNL
ncbi:hypothetical protein EVAR_87897_1 [Eumeta japonica]|uniref:Uncharacterized protein n=1 Tax=Eumeta variegata TaxID=151549 RepID=A0A4C1WXL9_EUMVA|nr:hypothetical protein EVAR_87897_1 [Eumeta japonica]